MQEDGGGYDTVDLQQLLGSIGIVGKVPCNTIMDLHNRIRAVDPRAVSVSQLLQTASLVHQQLERGVHLTVAIRKAAVDVYLTGHKDISLKKVNLLSIAFEFYLTNLPGNQPTDDDNNNSASNRQFIIVWADSNIVLNEAERFHRT